MAWQARAGAIGGGSVARFRWRSIVRMTSAWVMAAMIRSVPCPHAGQRAMAKANTRFSSRSQPQRGETLPASGGCHAVLAWGRDDAAAALTV